MPRESSLVNIINNHEVRIFLSQLGPRNPVNTRPKLVRPYWQVGSKYELLAGNDLLARQELIRRAYWIPECFLPFTLISRVEAVTLSHYASARTFEILFEDEKIGKPRGALARTEIGT